MKNFPLFLRVSNSPKIWSFLTWTPQSLPSLKMKKKENKKRGKEEGREMGGAEGGRKLQLTLISEIDLALSNPL